MVKRSVLAFNIFLLALMVAVAAPGADSRADSLEERKALAQAIFDEVVFDQMSNQVVDAMLPFFRMSLDQQLAAKGLTLSEEDKAKIATIVAEESKALITRLMPQTVEIYAQVLSEAELSALLAFYRTPEGASAMQKIPQLAQAMIPVLNDELANLAPVLEQRLEAEVMPPAAQQ